MFRIPTLDTPATETDRYSEAGAEIIVAIPCDETVVFIKRRLSITDVLPYLKGLDYVILEGFEHEATVPKIIAAKTLQEAERYNDGSAIALSGVIVESEVEIAKATILKLPIIKSLTEAGKLADLVEKH